MKNMMVNKNIAFLGLLAILGLITTGCQITRERSEEDLATRTASYELKRLQHNFDNYRIEKSNETKTLNQQINELSKELLANQEQIRYIKQYLIDINNGVKPKEFVKAQATSLEPQLNINDNAPAIDNNNNDAMIRESGKITNSRIKAVNSDEYYVHTVESGETLTGISKQYAISIKEIKEANRLDNSDRIFIGQKLYIPKR